MSVVPHPLLIAVATAVMAVSVLSGCSSDRSAEGGPEAGLDDPANKEIAMQLVSSAENSSLDRKAQYMHIEDIGDGRGLETRLRTSQPGGHPHPRTPLRADPAAPGQDDRPVPAARGPCSDR
ncbi:chitosanase [Streptomyces sp. NPDC088246]|uniref:chitosanase n=1 Tax=Streptomyces sp. NPDC088246 TaxID=3365842 RepID=UPI00381025BF